MYSLGPELFLFPAVQFKCRHIPGEGRHCQSQNIFREGGSQTPLSPGQALGVCGDWKAASPPKKPHVDPSQSRRILSPLAGGLTPQRVLGGLTSGAHCTAGGQQPNNITQCYTVAKVNIPPVPSRGTWGETHWLPTGKTKDNAIGTLTDSGTTGKALHHHGHLQKGEAGRPPPCVP